MTSHQSRNHDQLPRVATVDIGSNSIRLVVYQGSVRVPAILFNEKVTAGLGRDLSSTGAIGADSMALAIRALHRFWRLCGEMEVDEILCFATAAMRDATNAKVLLKAAKKIGFFPQILSGNEESELAGYGVLSAFPGAKGIVGDLGGGSLELALIGDGKVLERNSFPLGILRIADMRSAGKDKLKRQVRKMLQKTGWGEGEQGLPFYMVGGSWRALARVDMHTTGYPLPVIHHYTMEPGRSQRLVSQLARLNKAKLKAVPGLSSSRIAALPDAAWLLSYLVRTLGSSQLIVSAYGVREGMLFRRISEEDAARDPLLSATRESGAAQARFPANSKLLDEWISTVFDDDPAEWKRIRQAACNLSDVAWRANPSFRASRGLEIGMHGNWVGIDGPGRELLGQTLYTSFGGGTRPYPGSGGLAGGAATERAICWGLAMRLGQRLSGGTRGPLEQTRLRTDGSALILEMPAALADLYGDAVAKRHIQLATRMAMEARFVTD